MLSFKELNLNQNILKSLMDLDFKKPTPIQEKAIPFILKSSNDLTALAQTGTGKTAAFGLPILNQIIKNNQQTKKIESIILCPTRELCLQISKDLQKFIKYSKNISITPVYGGERIDIQIKKLQKGTNIVVGTPGRVCDLIRRRDLKLQFIKWLVLDEADEMLDMGFKEDLDIILKETPRERQTLLFSATMSKSVNSIAKHYMKNAHEISVSKKNVGANNISHEYYLIHSKDRFEALKRILDSLPSIYGILFCRTRRETQEIADKLKKFHYNTEAMHGDISQNMRTKIMDRFREKEIKLLVATDVAARGIDINNLSHIINYQLPDKNEIYTHRSGRTGRASKSGVCISIVNSRELYTIKRLEVMLEKTFIQKQIPNAETILNTQVDNFIKEVSKTKIKENDDMNYQKIIKKLDKIEKKDLIKHFIDLKFKKFIESYKNSNDLNTDFKSINKKYLDIKSINLKINFGKEDGLDIKTLFDLINSNRSLKGIIIGKIKLMPKYTIFSVEEKFVSKAIKFLGMTRFNGQKIIIKKSKENIKSGYRNKSRFKTRPKNRNKFRFQSRSKKNFTGLQKIKY